MNTFLNRISVTNFHFSVGVDTRGQLGNVLINKSNLSITPAVKNNVSSVQLATLSKRTMVAYDILQDGHGHSLSAEYSKDAYSIRNFCFSLVAKGGSQIGNVIIKKNADIFISPGVSKRLQDSELAIICMRAFMAYGVLKIGDPTSGKFSFNVEHRMNDDSFIIKQSLFENPEVVIASIKKKKLLFHTDIPRYIRCVSIKYLKDTHITDFYYQGFYYS